MPRSGYDLTGAAQGSPASEAAARARQKADPAAQSTAFARAAIPVSTSQDMGFLNAQAPFGASSRQPIDSGAANSRAEQHLFQRSGGRFHAMPVSQHVFPTHHNRDPNAQSPFYSSHSRTGTGPSDTVDEDAEMTDVDGQRHK